jgi:hypothetical protein
MQYVEPLLGIALIFTSFLVNAQMPADSQGNPEAVAPSPAKHAAQGDGY